MCLCFHTCRSWWADAGERVGAVNTAAQSARVRFAVVNVHFTPFAFKPGETRAQVAPAAGGQADVGHAGSSVQTFAGRHGHLTGREGKIWFERVKAVKIKATQMN